MSFRGRLIVFFVLLVALPMVAVVVLVSEVTGSSATGKTDAALDADLDVASGLYNELIDDGVAVADKISRDEEFGNAVATGDEAAIAAAARRLAAQLDVVSLEFRTPGGRTVVAVGAEQPFAVGSLSLVNGEGGPPAGTLRVSIATVAGYLRQVRQRTGERAVIAGGGKVDGTAAIDPGDVPESGTAGDVELRGDEFRIAAEALPGSAGRRVAIVGATDSGGFFASRPAVVAALILFFSVALIAVGVLTRTLQGQVAAMLAAARRIGEGDFSQKVPVEGRDELAGLAREFNKMSERLAAQMTELRRQQQEIETSVERIGQAFASGLDRVALLKILVETAVTACSAEYGLVALTGRDGAEAEAGTASEPVRGAALAAEHRAVRNGGVVESAQGGAVALASSLGRMGADGEAGGAMTVARAGLPFAPRERDVFLYLVGQAAASVENVALHELVSEQAVTDDLTGLPNNRAFREAFDKEVSRAHRFDHELSLVILDLDDFKRVNDTYGHLQGDAVLRAVGQIVDDESRGIDAPARYGGEEFVVALPETSLEGAVEVAERIRARVEQRRIPRVEGEGELRVTASLGVATLPGSGEQAADLFAAADAALYEAKRGGKNQVRTAAPAKGPAPARRK